MIIISKIKTAAFSMETLYFTISLTGLLADLPAFFFLLLKFS